MKRLSGGIVPLIPLLAAVGTGAASGAATAGMAHAGLPVNVSNYQNMVRDPVVQHALQNIQIPGGMF
jgi:hypothetical protein